MFVKKYIRANLTELDAAFLGAAADPKACLYYSKLAVLELCGWIEISMDDMVKRHSKRNLKLGDNIKFVDDVIIKRNYGFDYQRNFRNMLMRMVGIVECEKIESAMPAAVLTKFTSQLTNLKQARNRLAHTYLDPHAPIVIDAPSVTASRLDDLYSGLRGYDTALCHL